MAFKMTCAISSASQVALVVKNLLTKAEDIRDVDSIPASGRSPGGGNGNLLQYSYLENPRDGGAWRATVYEVAKSRRRLNDRAHTVRINHYLEIRRAFPPKEQCCTCDLCGQLSQADSF